MKPHTKINMKQISLQDISPEIFGNRAVVRRSAERDKESYRIPLDKIVVIEGFNPRTEFTGIEELAASILTNGQENPGTVIVFNDGTFGLYRGERRYRALKLLQESGHKNLYFRAFVSDKNLTVDDLYFQELSTQHVCHLKADEVGELIQRLITAGYTQSEIAKRSGRSQSWVSQMISFLREDDSVKELVKSGKTSVSTVLKTKSRVKNKKERTEKLTTAAESGKVKLEEVTGETVRYKKRVQLADKICEALSLNDEQREVLFQILNKSL